MPAAYIYARWSSLEQSKGSTLDRQIRNCEEFAAAKGWPIEETIIDRGRSAYTGANIQSGNLGGFAQRVLSGAIPLGSYLIVEELDRLSRQSADIMLTWLSPLIRAGLTVCVTQTGQTIDRNTVDYDIGGLMLLMIEAFGGHQESRKKADRVASAWDKKRRDAREGKTVTTAHRHPGWLKAVEGGFEAIPDRVEIVRTIFANRVERGIGKGMTAKELNDAGVPTWRSASHWTATYVGRVLCNRAVLGEWQPHVWARKDQARKAIGEAITGYYPKVIDETTFALANSEKLSHQLKTQGRGKGISNLLGPKAHCAKCGGVMDALGSARYRINKDGSKTRHYFLYCRNAKMKTGLCDHQLGWTYDRIEVPLLDNILVLAMDDQAFASDNLDIKPLEQALLVAKSKVTDLAAKIDRLFDLAEDGDPMATSRLRTRQAEWEAAKAVMGEAEAALAAARGTVSPEAHIKRVNEVRALIHDDDEEVRYQARQRVKAALQDVILDMQFDPVKERVRVNLVGNIGVMFITRSGEGSFYTMHKLGRAHDESGRDAEERDVIRSMMRRDVALRSTDA